MTQHAIRWALLSVCLVFGSLPIPTLAEEATSDPGPEPDCEPPDPEPPWSSSTFTGRTDRQAGRRTGTRRPTYGTGWRRITAARRGRVRRQAATSAAGLSLRAASRRDGYAEAQHRDRAWHSVVLPMCGRKRHLLYDGRGQLGAVFRQDLLRRL